MQSDLDKFKGKVFDLAYHIYKRATRPQTFVDPSDLASRLNDGTGNLYVSTEDVRTVMQTLCQEGYMRLLTHDNYGITTEGKFLGEHGGYSKILAEKEKENKRAEELLTKDSKLNDLHMKKLEGEIAQQSRAVKKALMDKQEAFFVSSTRRNNLSLIIALAALIVSILTFLFKYFS